MTVVHNICWKTSSQWCLGIGFSYVDTIHPESSSVDSRGRVRRRCPVCSGWHTSLNFCRGSDYDNTTVPICCWFIQHLMNHHQRTKGICQEHLRETGQTTSLPVSPSLCYMCVFFEGSSLTLASFPTKERKHSMKCTLRHWVTMYWTLSSKSLLVNGLIVSIR